MANPLSASVAMAAFRAEGCLMQEYQNWTANNRNHKGAWGPVNGVMIHHTVTSADDSSVALCYNGHSTLPGPLCHTVGRNDGRLAMVGWGRANHAGLGDPDVLQAVINESPTLPPDNQATVDGNARFYGLEIVNLGNGSDTYPWVQYVAAVKWATALCRAHGWSERSVIGHKEWQPGKIDPYGPVVSSDGTFAFDMNRFRADVKAALALPAGQWPKSSPPENEEQDMAITDEDAKKIARFVMTGDSGISSPDDPDVVWAASSYLQATFRKVRTLEAEVDLLQGQVEALSTGGVDLDALARKVADVLSARLRD